MTICLDDDARRIVFVARTLSGESLRNARAILALEGVQLFGICESAMDGAAGTVFRDIIRIPDAGDRDLLIAAAHQLAGKHGRLARIVTTTETLLEASAEAGEALGLQGLASTTIRCTLDKTCLKEVLRRAGTGTARHCLVTCLDEANRFAGQTGFPIVLKPRAGSGGLATLRVHNLDELAVAVGLMQPSGSSPVLAEEFLQGQELCIDTISVAGEPRFYSICVYRTPILQALEDLDIQWSCVMPRDISKFEYAGFVEQGLASVRALSVGNAMTHMEGFITSDGAPAFTDATLRPAGARIGPMLAFAYDMDPYLAWARVAVDGCFDGPWERKFAVGTVFVRGTGTGRVAGITGLDTVEGKMAELIVDRHLPKPGAPAATTYTGDGYFTIRHPETHVVEGALDFIARTVRITYTLPNQPRETESTARSLVPGKWQDRLQYRTRGLYRPVWEEEAARDPQAPGDP